MRDTRPSLRLALKRISSLIHTEAVATRVRPGRVARRARSSETAVGAGFSEPSYSNTSTLRRCVASETKNKNQHLRRRRRPRPSNDAPADHPAADAARRRRLSVLSPLCRTASSLRVVQPEGHGTPRCDMTGDAIMLDRHVLRLLPPTCKTTTATGRHSSKCLPLLFPGRAAMGALPRVMECRDVQCDATSQSLPDTLALP
jgi:hypothetical protein